MVTRRFGIACLISAVIGLSAAVTPASAASTYTWTISCRGNYDASVYWTWLQDGQAIIGSETWTGCTGTDKVSGGGDIPVGATGVYAQLRVFAWDASDDHSQTVSFGASGSFSVSLHGSIKWTGDVCEAAGCNVIQSYHEAATFKMS
jgi:hypothetical protein